MNEKKDIIFSVIIPVYNEERYLDECIRSIQNQTYKNLEIILVDDGSKKECADKYDEYPEKDCRIKIIHQDNRGPLIARKVGIEVAIGSYIIFVDADDWIEPRLCEHYYKYALLDIDMIGISNYFREYKNGDSLEVFDNKREGIWKKEEFEKKVLPYFIRTSEFFSTEYFTSMCTYAFKKELTKKVVEKWDKKIKIVEDYAFVMLSFLSADKLAVIPYRGYHYRYNNKSISNTKKHMKSEFKRVYDLINNQIKQTSYNQLELKKKNDLFMFHNLMITDCNAVLDCSDKFLFPYPTVSRGSRIIIYGAGAKGLSLYKALQNKRDYTVVAIADRNTEVFSNEEFFVIKPEEIINYEFDYIVITISYPGIRKKIVEYLKNQGIEEDKIAQPDISVMDGGLMYQ